MARPSSFNISLVVSSIVFTHTALCTKSPLPLLTLLITIRFQKEETATCIFQLLLLYGGHRLRAWFKLLASKLQAFHQLFICTYHQSTQTVRGTALADKHWRLTALMREDAGHGNRVPILFTFNTTGRPLLQAIRGQSRTIQSRYLILFALLALFLFQILFFTGYVLIWLGQLDYGPTFVFIR